MTTREEYTAKYDELYGFLVDALVSTFEVATEIHHESVLSDDLGLEPLEWFDLSDMVAEKYGIVFEKEDLTRFDWDLPTVDEFVRMVLVKLNLEPPIDYDALSKVAVIIEEVMGIESSEVTSHKELKGDLEIDSMSLVEIASKCEDEFQVTISDTELFGFTHVRDLVTCVSSQKLTPVAV